MKKWIATLICLGYFSPIFGTSHDTFLVTGADLQELSYFPGLLQTPNFFTQCYPKCINPNLVIVPRTNSGFLFGVTGIAQRATGNQLDYATLDYGDLSGLPFYSPGLFSTTTSIEPSFKGGFGAYIGYIFPYTGKDVLFDFSIIDGSSSDSADAPLTGTLWTPLPLYNRTNEAFTAAAQIETDVRQAKLVVGDQLFAGTRLRLHPAIGLKYANINRDLTTAYGDAETILRGPFGSTAVQQKSEFNGLGPAVQLDGTLLFVPHFGVVGHLTNAILIGAIQSELTVSEAVSTPPTDIIAPGNTTINLRSTNRTVANLDGKLGLFYEYPFCGSLMKMDIELGYEFNHFFNAVDTYRSAGGVLLTGAFANLNNTYVDTPLHIKQIDDLSVDGPYLSVGLSGISCPDNAVIDPVCVTVPRLEGGFVFGVGAVYYRAEANQRDYAMLDPFPTNIENLTTFLFPQPLLVPSLNARLKDVQADQAYGLMVNVGYIFKDSPYDVTAHFEGSQTQDHGSAIPSELEGGVIWPILSVPFLNNIQDRIIATEARANIKFNYGEFHIDIGQAINADSLLWLRVFEGVEAAGVKQNFHVTYSNLITLPVYPSVGSTLVPIPIFFPQEDIVQKSEFSGVGPRIGLDIGVPMGNFALVGELASGFLVGQVDASYLDDFQTGVLPNPVLGAPPIPVIPEQFLGTRVENEAIFSPFMDLKVALAYTFNFFLSTKWTVEVGYKAAHYFNAITTFRHVTNNAAIFAKQVGDVTIDGPYVNFTVFGFGACPPTCVPRDPFNVYVPELKGGFELAFEGAYLQPHVANIDYGIWDPLPAVIPDVPDAFAVFDPTIPDFPTGLPINPSAFSSTQVLRPRARSGTKVHVGYIFPLTSNDISLNFATFQQTTTKFTTAPESGVLWTVTNGDFGAQIAFGQTLFPVFANRADVKARFDWQTHNIEFGKRVKFHDLMARFFAGLTYAKIKEDIDILYTDGLTNFLNPIPVFIPADFLVQRNDFSGIGPRLGIAGDLALGCGFSLIGQIGTDLLVGKFDSDFIEVSTFGQVAAINPDKRKRYVPALDGKFGGAYSVVLKNCSQVSLELGYEVNHYFNAKDSLRFTDYSASFVKQDQDISFDGPYVRLQVNF